MTVRAHRMPPVRLVLVCALAFGALVAATPAFAADKVYSIPSVNIEAQANADGSLDVVERRTYNFESGDFTRVWWEMPAPTGGTVEVVSVDGKGGQLKPTTAEGRPPGTYRVTTSGSGVLVEAYGKYSNETIPFVLRLRYTKAITRWADTAELYWQAIASNWTIGVADVSITIKPPPAVETSAQVKAWVHGPLTGSVHIQPDGVVVATVKDLPSLTFVEPRVLFPSEALPDAQLHDIDGLPNILAQEKASADAANEQRLKARQQAEEDARFRASSGWFGTVMAVLATAVVAVLFFRWGREYKPTFSGQYFREPPADLHPGVVGYLMNMGTVPDSVMSATLMDLADKGAIRMEPTKVEHDGLFGSKTEDTYLLTCDTTKWATLRPLDQKLLSFLFTDIAGDDTLTIDEMKSEAKSRPSEFQNGVLAFKTAVTTEAESLGLLEKSGKRARIAAWLITGAAVLSSCWCLMASANIWAMGLGIVCLIAMVVMSGAMARRSPAANELFAKYSALRNYLKDFSRLNEVPPSSVVLWNQFLVLAVVFGIASEVIEQMRVRVPEVLNDPTFATTYWWVYSGAGTDAPISALSSGLASAASIASSELSSSSGGGGGFSGGGGGGFGGGGGGGAD